MDNKIKPKYTSCVRHWQQRKYILYIYNVFYMKKTQQHASIVYIKGRSHSDTQRRPYKTPHIITTTPTITSIGNSNSKRIYYKYLHHSAAKQRDAITYTNTLDQPHDNLCNHLESTFKSAHTHIHTLSIPFFAICALAPESTKYYLL